MLHHRNIRRALLGATALAGAASLGWTAPAAAQVRQVQFDIAPQPLSSALREYGASAEQQLIYSEADVRRFTAPALQGAYTPDEGLAMLLAGTGLMTERTPSGILRIVSAQDPQSESAAGDGADGTVDALIVTAQKREEDIQDVPIAISAFTQEALERSQVAGGPDLMTQVPNMTFTKTNFSSYSIQIRGIGTQAISATTDAAVAVAFNNTPFIRNRFFEQEFYDLQRVEVLRGPQGTLYGRNATAGVVNIISNKPKFGYEAKLSADIANYNSTRVEGMVNVPLVDDIAALRLAAAWTKRDGYVTNEITGNPIDGRDLWSTRLSLRLAPTDGVDINLIWEHFEEDDDRLRSGKQLCKTDQVTEVGDTPVFNHTGWENSGNDLLFSRAVARFNQGCVAASLYSPESFGTPNGLALPYYLPLSAVFLPAALEDPYVNRTQSHDLRVIESTVDPDYRARSDLAELQISVDLGGGLTLASETSYSADVLFSQQDYNRFNTAPGAWKQALTTFNNRQGVLTPGEFGGVFCDPQIGCADRLVAIDLSTAKSRQFSQEFRLSSDYDGGFNFSLGANFLRYDTEDKYYVFINSLTMISAIAALAGPLTPYVAGETDNHECMPNGPIYPDPSIIQGVGRCTYIDPNPIESLNDLGHNYFLSRNPYRLISYAVFGETYYNITESLKITGGLRWTVDHKRAPRIPSWVIADITVGYPVIDVTVQDWSEPTGRLAIDWKPDVPFTDETLLYASYAHGYKAGGANPPPTGPVGGGGTDINDAVVAKSATHPRTFEPEFVDAFEVGAKNTFLDGRLTLNLAAFYYDYTGYQISQIVNRSAVNLNFDADVSGLEIEADWRPLENLRFGFKGGYEQTRVADGMQAVDLMDRTAGHDDWLLVRPYPTYASNCILPLSLTERPGGLYQLGGVGGGRPGGCEIAYVLGLDPVTQQPYDPNTHIIDQGFSPEEPYLGFDPSAAPNNGEGFYKDLSGNELPNAPDFTVTITADYTIPLPNEWFATLHTDLYYQSEAWTRIFNMEGYDKLKAYSNINLAAIFTNEDAGWKVMAYVKNVLDKDSITGAFLNSDDTGLTTNVFLTEPRLYGLRVTKDWTGGAWWTSDGSAHPVGQPYPFTLELGGQLQRHEAPYNPVAPSFADVFSSALDSANAQNRDLDWGDGREFKLTYAVAGGRWTVSAGMRTGEANNGGRYLATELGDSGCLFTAPCPPASYPNVFNATNYNDSTVADREEHTLADFEVGRDVGLGFGGKLKSRLSAGLRYADFKSTTHLDMVGIPDWEVPDAYAFFGNPSQHHLYEADLIANREFQGAGPIASWEASAQLFGDEAVGHIDLDWRVEGGVLFGKQKTFAEGDEEASYFNGPYYYQMSWQVGPTVVSGPEPSPRSDSVTVPTFAASLGLSYAIQRIRVRAGYRWERYFDVLNADWSAHEDVDRTIDGPYFKIAVGFGG